MIISKTYAKKLESKGKAETKGNLVPDERGHVYAILYRYDIQRTDHYRVA